MSLQYVLYHEERKRMRAKIKVLPQKNYSYSIVKTHNILFIQINDAVRIRFTMMIIEDGLQGGKMITYCQFIAAVKQKVESNINRNVRVEVHITLKNNGKERRGLVFIEEGINISPTIYLEEFYQNFREGKALDGKSLKIF